MCHKKGTVNCRYLPLGRISSYRGVLSRSDTGKYETNGKATQLRQHKHAIKSLRIRSDRIGNSDNCVGRGPLTSEVNPIGGFEVRLVLQLVSLSLDGTPGKNQRSIQS